MSGTAKEMVDKFIAEKSNGDKVIESGLRVKLILKGIPVNKLTPETPDDPALINKIKTVMQEYSIGAL